MSSYSLDALNIDPATGLPKKKAAAKPQPLTPSAWGPGGPGWQQAQGLLPGGGSNAGGNSYSPFNVPGSTPDYKALITAALGPMAAQFGADDIADQNTRDQQLIRALGQFGQQFDLNSATQAFGQDFVNQSGLAGVLPQANDLAQKTTDAGLSYTARAAKTHADSIRAIKNALASRGLLRSGELGHQLQEEQGRFDTGQYDARSQVQDFLGAITKGYSDAVRARQSQMAGAQRDEAVHQAQINPATAAQQATWDGTAYRYPDGTLVPRGLWPTQAGPQQSSGSAMEQGIAAALAAPHDPSDVISRLLKRG